MADKFAAANGAAGIIMDVNTGGILAMASYPNYDLNDFSAVQDQTLQERIARGENTLAEMQLLQWRNKALNDTYEPGSTFKILTLAAALEGPALQAAYVTNGIAHARMMLQKGCRIYLRGGQVRPITEAITGPETLAALQHYNFTKAFMRANGVSPAEGFTTPDPEEASIKTAALQRARERWFLVDNTKFDMVYSAVIGDIGCGAILTNHCPDPRYSLFFFFIVCSV